MSAEAVRVVDAVDWLASLTAARDAGYTWFDDLGCVDEIGRSHHFRIFCALVNWDAGPLGVRFEALVPRDAPLIDSLSALFAGASWCEREAHDFFGVRFTGGDDRPILVHEPGHHPLRKDAVLGARAVIAWPGAEGADSAPGRRRMVPPGVPDPAVWGARAVDDPVPTATEVAQSAVGGRVRRRT